MRLKEDEGVRLKVSECVRLLVGGAVGLWERDVESWRGCKDVS